MNTRKWFFVESLFMLAAAIPMVQQVRRQVEMGESSSVVAILGGAPICCGMIAAVLYAGARDGTPIPAWIAAAYTGLATGVVMGMVVATQDILSAWEAHPENLKLGPLLGRAVTLDLMGGAILYFTVRMVRKRGERAVVKEVQGS